MKATKEAAIQFISSLLEEKVKEAQEAISNAKESRDNETKSSAGDKHETGRAMSQIELENAELQLSKVLNLKGQFLQIDLQKKRNTIEPGSLVKTNKGLYFITIGIGKIEVNNEICYAISKESPIGKVMINKRIGDTVSFQNKEIYVVDIL